MGRLLMRNGNTVVADADADMQVPHGGKFIPAPMHYFMRFTGADGMHAGYLPGYPASHGCVRMPEQYAIAFFNAVQVGTPVTVFGRTPVNRYYSGQPQPFAGLHASARLQIRDFRLRLGSVVALKFRILSCDVRCPRRISC